MSVVLIRIKRQLTIDNTRTASKEDGQTDWQSDMTIRVDNDEGSSASHVDDPSEPQLWTIPLQSCNAHAHSHEHGRCHKGEGENKHSSPERRGILAGLIICREVVCKLHVSKRGTACWRSTYKWPQP